ncbi:pyruvate formate lyase activating enzyme [Austwickia chelonae]|uniref:Glycyl-radical enzyme activating family protein n=1 Tax=Austwickia chelonae NBRC 105200 TaxID=1184607 RepID=K6V886_9MICO|nr:glycyl-radical enzyme activating protein [Austwickia chelonae]GAB78438.1 glycyl-radical enzyme activating family protein [Austwickia chelonae NBRC 105200]SEW39530.1 pyruvate formate lyase activating enzyme [Austwickia chelonae]
MPPPSGRIFNIQKFSLHDGPGIRTVVFLKGCPLDCQWCANPNSRVLQAIPMRDATDPRLSEDDSRLYPLDDVVRRCLQDLPFYQESGGGVTLSGGEPLVQHAFATALLAALQAEGVHTAIETTGHIAPRIFTRALEHCDHVIIDVKHHDRDAHRAWTGTSNDLALTNLTHALERDLPVWVRIPVIPGVNDSLDDARAFAALLTDRGVRQVQLLPFHQMGERKYELLGWEYAFLGVPSTHEEDLADFRAEIEAHGVRAGFDAPDSRTESTRIGATRRS